MILYLTLRYYRDYFILSLIAKQQLMNYSNIYIQVTGNMLEDGYLIQKRVMEVSNSMNKET